MPVLSPAIKDGDVRKLVQMLNGDNSGGHQGDGCTGRLEPGSRKKVWSNLAKRYFRVIGDRMGLVMLESGTKIRGENIPEGRFEVYFNPGGPAVAGDVYLNTSRLHVCLSGSPMHGMGFYYRYETKKPSMMGGNRWLPVEKLLDIDYVVKMFKGLHEQDRCY